MTDLLLVSCALGMCGGRVPKPFSNISTYYVWFNSWLSAGFAYRYDSAAFVSHDQDSPKL